MEHLLHRLYGVDAPVGHMSWVWVDSDYNPSVGVKAATYLAELRMPVKLLPSDVMVEVAFRVGKLWQRLQHTMTH